MAATAPPAAPVPVPMPTPLTSSTSLLSTATRSAAPWPSIAIPAPAPATTFSFTIQVLTAVRSAIPVPDRSWTAVCSRGCGRGPGVGREAAGRHDDPVDAGAGASPVPRRLTAFESTVASTADRDPVAARRAILLFNDVERGPPGATIPVGATTPPWAPAKHLVPLRRRQE